METTFAINMNTRNLFLNFLENYSLVQLNTTPSGFSNNLIWNINHCIVTQQLLVYKLAGEPLFVPDNFVERYRKGTKPTADLSSEDIHQSKEYLFSTISKTVADYEAGVFQKFNAYPTSSGFTITTLEAALEYNNFHEGLHLGIMMQIRKFV
jgi:hypothetical protein